MPPPPPPPHLLAPPAVSASPGVSAGLRDGLHRTRRGGSHSSSSAQARSDRTHGARTAGRVASYYGGRFGLISSPLPPTPGPSLQLPDYTAAQAQRGPCQTCVCRVCIQQLDSPNGNQDQVQGAGPRRKGRCSSVRKWVGQLEVGRVCTEAELCRQTCLAFRGLYHFRTLFIFYFYFFNFYFFIRTLFDFGLLLLLGFSSS